VPRSAARQLDLMRPGKPLAAGLAVLALTSAAFLAGAPLASAEGALSPRQYGVESLCSLPAPGHSACLGVSLVAKAPLSLPGTRALPASPRAASATSAPAAEFVQPLPGVTPSELRGAYGLAAVPAPASTQTIAIVDAYDDPTAEADLARFSSQFGLPACTAADGCFRKVNQEGKAVPLPTWKNTSTEQGWALEIATDIETAHAVCPSCHIVLVEAKSNSNADLYPAENAAAGLGATEISNSFGGGEPTFDSSAFNHPGIVITASAGDSGYMNWLGSGNSPDYPASSPHVVAVGGTRLRQSGGKWESETVWNDGGEEGGKKTGAGASGGGCSWVFAAPPWQQQASTWSSIGCSHRAVSDVAADGDPYTGVDVYDSTVSPNGNTGWTVVGGTSVASPIIAAIYALAGGAHGVEYPARTVYENAATAPGAWLHDVTSGSNGRCGQPFNESTGASGCTTSEEAASCSSHGSCLAGAGYDGPSGVGTPRGIGAFLLPSESKESPPAEETPKPPDSGSSPGAAPSPTPAPSDAAGARPEAEPGSGAVGEPVKVSGLKLTRSGKLARRLARARLTRLGFSFTLSAPDILTVSLEKWVRTRRGGRWRGAAQALNLEGIAGRQSGYLDVRHALRRGRYQLTVTPESGVPASVAFVVT
jgi:Subtilase family